MNKHEAITSNELIVTGRLVDASNATLYAHVVHNDLELTCIYKPIAGERPLWDFPAGLYQREVAAYLLSEAMDIHVIPPTIERDGPFGIGSLQWFIDARFEEHYFTLYEAREDLHDQFRNMAAFDIVANNTDRKSGHCLIDNDDRIWGIDQGLCFSAEFKLRTVIWEFGGEPIAPDLIAKIQRIVDRPPLEVAALLDADEIDAMIERASMLAQGGMFPIDASGQRYPWPMV